MRNPLTLVAALGLSVLCGCTVQDTKTPDLAGPSTFARAMTLKASPETIFQNGFDTSVITVSATGPDGRPIEILVRAEIQVGGVTQDFGSLSSKARVTDRSTGTTQFVYTAPPLPSSGVAAAQLVTLAFRPEGTDFGSEPSRTVDIRVLPPGTIGPTNPTLVATFTITPAAPTAYSTATFDASGSTNQGTACAAACAYSWNFGDGTTGTGITTTHEYRSSGAKTVTLTVADSIGATSIATQTITVGQSTPPTPLFQISPSSAGVNQDVFLNASESRPATGRTIVRYDWAFGDGETGSGVTVTHKFRAPGSYQVILTVTDDVGASAQRVTGLTVVLGNPIASLSFLPAAPRVGQPVAFDAGGSTSATGSTITSYKFNYGDGSPEESAGVPNQTHVYGAPGTVAATVTVTDSLGRTASKSVSVTIVP